MIARQYRPAFFEGFENEEIEFSTIDELLHIDWIRNFYDGVFLKWTLSDRNETSKWLFAVSVSGGEVQWWCAAIIENITPEIIHYFDNLKDTMDKHPHKT